MSYSAYCILNIRKCIITKFSLSFPKNGYAKKDSGSISMIGGTLKKKKLSKLGPITEKKLLPVEEDPNKLVSYVCGTNIYKTGEDVILKENSEYPDWLWSIRLGPPPTLEELDPDSKEYWRKIRKMGMRRNNQMAKFKKL
ncbi:39S ribosomal protein L54, mitochondrial [Diorhabda carinulata]|uniref:39S ribosomal protein L54, mitochondrial n=1 Tax=Diorhabda carinulata TaxID=1163345 RepID=UPI0025A0AAFE|nr:39S ribosomal protein L54, mitochondrial [Diorhabda carinulata]